VIVCHCTGVTDRDIRSLARQGHVKTARDVTGNCSAGRGCGGCELTIEQIVRQETACRATDVVLPDLVPAL
jgi:bacterioferritin-associated ferredoxin